MKTFKFEIQSLITVEVEADSKENARIQVVDNLQGGTNKKRVFG